MARSLRSTGDGSWLAAIISALLVPMGLFAQPVPADDGTTLYLVVRTKPSVPEKRIIDTIKAGLNSSLHAVDGEPSIKPVSPLFFDQFAELIGTAGSGPAPATPKGELGIRPLPTRRGAVMELKLPTVKQALTKLTVNYQPVKDQPGSIDYIPSAPSDTAVTPALTLIEPGRYAFHPEPGRVPLDYVATVDERDDATKQLIRDKKIQGDWPQIDNYFVVTLKNFRKVPGGRHNHEQFMREIEVQNRGTANPISIRRLGGDQIFVFADMAGGGARVGSLVVGNTLELRVPAPVNRSTRRAWVLFPLTEQGFQDAVKKYANMPTTELPFEIRKNAVGVNETLSVGPDTPARWIEVPPEEPNPGVLYRRVPLKDLTQLAEKYPTVWQLTVWEFEHPTRRTSTGQPEREAILVQDENGRDVSARGSSIANWASELKRAK